ncbi:MAG: four helix bundle protein [Thermodesulfobacteriota bacterium]
MEEKPRNRIQEISRKSDGSVLVEMSGFRNLYVWRQGKALAVAVHRLTREGPFADDTSFRDQVRRSAIRIPSDIAEGDERTDMNETVRFLQMAKSALARLWTQLEIAHDINYISDTIMADMSNRCRKLDRMLGGQIKSRATVQ